MGWQRCVGIFLLVGYDVLASVSLAQTPGILEEPNSLCGTAWTYCFVSLVGYAFLTVGAIWPVMFEAWAYKAVLILFLVMQLVVGSTYVALLGEACTPHLNVNYILLSVLFWITWFLAVLFGAILLIRTIDILINALCLLPCCRCPRAQ